MLHRRVWLLMLWNKSLRKKTAHTTGWIFFFNFSNEMVNHIVIR